ncbi:hypothetical protein [Phocaeicola sartorii]|uniref:hypothetical protein n=1 Tax=Phocaeicola sartorii TaxID=671267 RepID=UPI00046AA901|nr:hypothetical protein [Phocaeicola sartorii]MCR1846275.1 hypothetical protein [Phocaeicola sartorii]GFI39553.1 hypothetical protein IMSAGC016_01331 [Muribaculaceae bacterium]
MKLLRALFYQYYWWQKRQEQDGFFVPLLAVLSVLCPIFGIIGFVMISADVTDIIDLKKFDVKILISAMFILELAALWWLLLRKKRYRAIICEHDVYNISVYRRLAVIYPILSATLFFIGLYIGYLYNSTAISQ